jgi:sirohydrochlorin ferrochelatase
MIPEINKAKGQEQQKLIQQYMGMGKDYAEKFAKLAEDNAKDPVAADAYFWILQNGAGSPAFKKAEEAVVKLVADMPKADVAKRVAAVRGTSPALLDAVLKRAVKAEDATDANLLSWLASARMMFPPGGAPKAVNAATDLLIEKFPDNPAVERLVSVLARTGDTDKLQKLADSAKSPKLKASATLGLAQGMVEQLDDVKPEEQEKKAADIEKVFAKAIELFAAADMKAQKDATERELKAFSSLRVGKEALEIKAEDLDGKEFKLSDYRGKVVMLDFWGHW